MKMYRTTLNKSFSIFPANGRQDILLFAIFIYTNKRCQQVPLQKQRGNQPTLRQINTLFSVAAYCRISHLTRRRCRRTNTKIDVSLLEKIGRRMLRYVTSGSLYTVNNSFDEEWKYIYAKQTTLLSKKQITVIRRVVCRYSCWEMHYTSTNFMCMSVNVVERRDKCV